MPRPVYRGHFNRVNGGTIANLPPDCIAGGIPAKVIGMRPHADETQPDEAAR